MNLCLFSLPYKNYYLVEVNKFQVNVWRCEEDEVEVLLVAS